jgi:hypothetical protein
MAICAACYIGLDPTIPRARAILHDVDQSSFRFLLGPADLPQIAFSSAVPGTGPEVFAAAAAMGPGGHRLERPDEPLSLRTIVLLAQDKGLR